MFKNGMVDMATRVNRVMSPMPCKVSSDKELEIYIVKSH